MSSTETTRTTRAPRKRAVLAAVGLVLVVGWLAISWREGEQRALRRSARAAFPTTEGTIGLPGLGGSVQVLRDHRGVPSIQAVVEADAWSALGFSHAQDRLAQMFWLRRLARGRTAEVIGEVGLPADRLARTLGIALHADAEAERLEPKPRQILEAYAFGVNSRMARIRAGLVAPPLELGAAGDLAEPWTPGDSLALVKLMAWSAGPAPETASVLWDLIDRLGAVAARPFMPTGLGVRGADTAIALPSERSGSSTRMDGRGEQGPGLRATSGSLLSGSTGGSALTDTLLASTAWVVSGRLTRSGAPMVAVDFDLPLTAPSLVYQAQLRAGDLDVAGVTVPGVPVFWAGRNRRVAWAATPARIMTADLYRETPNPEIPDEYRYGRRWEKVLERSEMIEVASLDGPPRRETLRVRATRHGPIVNDLIGRSGDPLTLAWTGALPGNGVAAMIEVARAGNASELRQALRDHHEPAIALLYADSLGNAGIQVAGWMPRRRLPTGLVPVPGRQTIFDWRDPVKPERLPHRELGSADWLVAADGPMVEGLGGRIEWLWRTGEVAARLESSLEAISQTGDPLEASDLAALRAKWRPLRSPEVLVALLQLAGERKDLAPEAREIADMLARWDGVVRSGSRGAAAMHLVTHHLTRELFSGPLGPSLLNDYLALSHTRPRAVAEQVVLAAAVSQGGPGWPEPDRVRRAVRASLRETFRSLSLGLGEDRDQWRWGRLVELRGPTLRPFAQAEKEWRLAVESGENAVTKTTTNPLQVSGVTGYRLVMDLASPDHLLSSLAPGQSEHPTHPHFDGGSDELSADRRQQLADHSPLVEASSTVAPESADPHAGMLRLVLEPVEPVESLDPLESAGRAP